MNHLNRYFQTLRESKIQSNTLTNYLPTYFQSIGLSCKEKAVYERLRIITVLSLPMCTIEPEEFSRFSRHDFKFSIECLKNVMRQVVELVEVAIGREISTTKGASIHNAWKNSSNQYIGIFASYMRRQKVWKGNNQRKISEHVITLHSMSPMMNIDEDDRNFDEATEFCAKTQCANIRDVFSFYKVDLGRYLVCHIQDNASVNFLLKTLLDVPFNVCLSQKLALQVKKMFDDDALLRAVMEGPRNTMSTCRKKTKMQGFIKKPN